jgi:hypothetical protein
VPLAQYIQLYHAIAHDLALAVKVLPWRATGPTAIITVTFQFTTVHLPWGLDYKIYFDLRAGTPMLPKVSSQQLEQPIHHRRSPVSHWRRSRTRSNDGRGAFIKARSGASVGIIWRIRVSLVSCLCPLLAVESNWIPSI